MLEGGDSLRKSHYINKITHKDTECLKALGRVGYLDGRMLKSLGITERRIQNLCRDNYLERCDYFDKILKQTSFVYRLSNRGEQILRQDYGVKYLYRSSSARHDIALATKYLTLTSNEKSTWKTETELREDYYNWMSTLHDDERYEQYQKWQDGLLSAIDASYISADGISQGIEIVTSSYTNAEIVAKEDFSCQLGIESTYIKI